MWASSSLCSSAVSHPSAHTVNGKHCCLSTFVLPSLHSNKNCYNLNSIKQVQYYKLSFNTVNGKCCCYITFVLPSLRSGTCNVWASSSHYSSAASHSVAHTVNGRRCCNSTKMHINASKLKQTGFNTVNGKDCCLITLVLPSLCSGKSCAGFIIALLLCCLAPFGAYRKQ